MHSRSASNARTTIPKTTPTIIPVLLLCPLPEVDDGVLEEEDEETEDDPLDAPKLLALGFVLDEAAASIVVEGVTVVEAGVANDGTMDVTEPPEPSGTTVNCTDKAEVTSGRIDEATTSPADMSELTSSWRSTSAAAAAAGNGTN